MTPNARAAITRIAWIAGGAAALLLALKIGVTLDPVAGSAPNMTTVTPGAALPALASLELRTIDGKTVTAGTSGSALIVMLASESCTYCEQALQDVSRLAAGRDLPGLWVIALEGAASSQAMLRRNGVRGARALGPTTSADATMLTFQTPGTPVFAVILASGKSVATIPGYAGKQILVGWLPVLLGASPAG